jgi:hypothetical protein
VAWLNSDDLYLPGAVNQAAEAFQETPQAKMIYGNAITIDSAGSPLNLLVFPDWGLEDLISFRIICQPAVFMRREAYQQVNGLDLSYHFMLDHQLWIRIAALGPIRHVESFWAAARHHEAAKNVSQSASFGTETLEVLVWMQDRADLAPVIRKNQRRVRGGAYRLNARYLLDGGQYGPALKSYGQAFMNQPLYAVRHWHRILYGVLGWIGVGNIDRLYARYQDSRRPDLSFEEQLQEWPGLVLH